MPRVTVSNDASVTDRLFNPQTLNPITRGRGSVSTRLEEKSCPDSIVDIVGLPDDARVVIIPGLPETCRYLNGGGLGARGDFTLVVPSQKKIIHIEMKRCTKSGIREQLVGSSALMTYFKGLAEKKLSERNYLDGYEERYVAIGYTACGFRNSSGRRSVGTGCTPDDIRRILYPGKLKFRDLL